MDPGRSLTSNDGDASPAPAPTLDAPAPALDRLAALDVLRGFAVLGIFAMNIQMFAMPFAAYWNPTIYLDYEGANRWTYLYTHLLFDMKLITLFSMLFGAGVVLYAAKARSRRDVPRVRALWLRRMGWLLLIGLIHAYFIWEGDILVAYAMCGLIAIWWLRRLPAWGCVLIALVLLPLPALANFGQGWWFSTVLSAESGADIGMPQQTFEEARAGVRESMAVFDPSREELDRLVSVYRGSYADVLPERAGMAIMIQTFYFLLWVWRHVGVMLIGVALMKWRVLTGERSVRFYAALAIVGYAIGWPLVYLGLRVNEAAGFEATHWMQFGSQYNYFGSLPVCLGHIGLVVGIYKSGALGALGDALAAAGRMALTNYLAQSVIGSLVFYGYGLGYYGHLSRLEQQLVVVATWLLILAWSAVWLTYFRFGPVEWLWRSLTYWRLRPMRHAPPLAERPSDASAA